MAESLSFRSFCQLVNDNFVSLKLIFMENLNVNELGMVDMTNYQLAVELLSNMDKDDSYLYDSIIAGGGRNYNCNDCGNCFR